MVNLLYCRKFPRKFTVKAKVLIRVVYRSYAPLTTLINRLRLMTLINENQ